jgi:hypothetical protein
VRTKSTILSGKAWLNDDAYAKKKKKKGRER